MVSDILFGQYIPTGSLIHGASPRLKIISLFLFTVSIFLIKSPYLYFYFIAISYVILKLSRLDLKFVLQGLRPLILLFLITFLINILFAEGRTVIWQWGIVTVTREGLVQGFNFFMRITLLVVFATLLTLTTSPIELSDGIEECLHPLNLVRFPVHEFSLMMTIALRFIPTLVGEIDKIRRAQEARGANFSEGGLMRRAMNFIPILIPLFIISFKRADELAIAMESRCYRGGVGRTKFNRRREGIYDYLMFALVAASLFPVLVIYFR